MTLGKRESVTPTSPRVFQTTDMRIRQQRPAAKGSAAFTLVEVVISVLVIAIGSAGLMSCIGYGFKSIQRIRENQRATQIILEKAETIRLFRQQHFDVAIIALMLPDMSGEVLAERLKTEIDPPPFVIAYTGNYRHREAALAAGCDAFIVKPGVEELLTLLARVAGNVATRN